MIDPGGIHSRFRRRNLPHWEVGSGAYFVTFRLAGSLPKHLEWEWREGRARARSTRPDLELTPDERCRRFQQMATKFDDQLDRGRYGPQYLQQDSIAKLVVSAINFYAGSHYDLACYVVMPNHVHAVLAPMRREAHGDWWGLDRILQGIKGYSGIRANRLLGRTGPFWQREYYDHLIRDDDDWSWWINYTLYNPVAAGLCKQPEQWPWSNARDFQE